MGVYSIGTPQPSKLQLHVVHVEAPRITRHTACEVPCQRCFAVWMGYLLPHGPGFKA